MNHPLSHFVVVKPMSQSEIDAIKDQIQLWKDRVRMEAMSAALKSIGINLSL